MVMRGGCNAVLNHITIMGRLTRDPELRRTASGVATASFTVAVARDFSSKDEKETDFIECVAWRSLGEFVNRYFFKGSMIVVSGHLQISAWTDKEGNKRQSAEVVAENVYFGERKQEQLQPVPVSKELPTEEPQGAYAETMAYINQLMERA